MPFLFPVRALLAAFLAAAPPPTAAPAAPAAACPAIDAPARPAPRVRAFIDPATGRLREPTPDELRRLAEERRAAMTAAGPRVFVIVEHPDGMKSVDLGDAFLFDVKLETGPDGSSRVVCIPPAGAAAHPAQ
jgi:hypothetical protein